jgi:hypothetical protein
MSTSFTTQPCLKFVMQSKTMIDRWDAPAETLDASNLTISDISASALYRNSRADPDPQNIWARLARTAYSVYGIHDGVPGHRGITDVTTDGFEYWSTVDASLSLAQGQSTGANGT